MPSLSFQLLHIYLIDLVENEELYLQRSTGRNIPAFQSFTCQRSVSCAGRAHCANAALACFDTNICTTHTGMRENKTFVDADFAQFFYFALGDLESTGAHNPVYVILPGGNCRRSLLCYCSILVTE